MTFDDLVDIPSALHYDEKSSVVTADSTIVRNCLNDLCDKVVEDETKDYQRFLIDQVVDSLSAMEMYGVEPNIQEESEKKFYHDFVELDLIKIINLCIDTTKQSECNEWFSARRCRISSSLRAHKIKTMTKKSAEELAEDFL